MGCHKHEETTPMEAPKSKGCHERRSFGPWSKMQQQQQQEQQHHHHHHHHHVHFNGMVWDVKPQEKHGHCHRSKHAGHWWGHHQQFAHLPQEKHLHEAPPKCFFRGMRQRNHNLPNYESHIVFDFSENYN
ncbi:hypothetical protein KR215_011733 [Drosophila sulfurigaster]|nr:hypothetical protein KR215_011733 [Drosophila sulfurigaster]